MEISGFTPISTGQGSFGERIAEEFVRKKRPSLM